MTLLSNDMTHNIIIIGLHNVLIPKVTRYTNEEDALTMVRLNCKKLAMIIADSKSMIVINDTEYGKRLGKVNFTDLKTRIGPELDLTCIQEKLIDEMEKHIGYFLTPSWYNGINLVKECVMDERLDKVVVVDNVNLSHTVNKNNGSYYIKVDSFISDTIADEILSKVK